MKIKKSNAEIAFEVLNATFMIFLMIITTYPFLYVLFASFSDPARIVSHSGILYAPLGFTDMAYRLVFENKMILIGYKNTLFIVIIGTFLNILATAILAYALSRKDLYWKKYIMMLIVFTMFFHGGLIPSYFLVKNLGLYDSRWALIFPGLIGTWNLIIMRTSFQAIPESLEESARIDGAKDFTILFKIIFPLSLPVISVMVLFYGVGHWNAWFGAMIYLRTRDLYPLQLVLREILIVNSTDDMLTSVSGIERGSVGEILKYATIIVATIPILCVYPFLQKYFVKGVMIGAVKG